MSNSRFRKTWELTTVLRYKDEKARLWAVVHNLMVSVIVF